MQVNHASLELRLPAVRGFLRDIVLEMNEILQYELLFDVTDLRTFTAGSLSDDWTRSEPG